MTAKKHDQSDYERMALEEVSYGNQHTMNVLLDLLIEKGVISEQEFRDKLEQMVEESPELDEVNIAIPDDEEPEE